MPCRSSASFKPHAPLARVGQLLVEEPTQSPQVVAKHGPSDGREGVGLCEGVWCGCMCEGGLCAPILSYEEHDKGKSRPFNSPRSVIHVPGRAWPSRAG